MQVRVDKFTKTVYRTVEEVQRDIARRGLNVRSFGNMLLEAHPVNPDEPDEFAVNGSKSE